MHLIKDILIIPNCVCFSTCSTHPLVFCWVTIISGCVMLTYFVFLFFYLNIWIRYIHCLWKCDIVWFFVQNFLQALFISNKSILNLIWQLGDFQGPFFHFKIVKKWHIIFRVDIFGKLDRMYILGFHIFFPCLNAFF